MNTSDTRSALAAQLRALADDVESGKMPYPGTVHLYTSWLVSDNDPDTWDYQHSYPRYERITQAHVRNVMAALPGNWSKNVYDTSINYVRHYGTSDDHQVTVTLEVNRTDQCTRVQVGTKFVPEVPAVPAHEEPEYRWICDPDTPDTPDTSDTSDVTS